MPNKEIVTLPLSAHFRVLRTFLNKEHSASRKDIKRKEEVEQALKSLDAIDLAYSYKGAV